MTHTLQSLAGPSNSLAPHYSRFKVAERLLLSGHSHQAWPDAAAVGQAEAFDAAARSLGDKWEEAFARAARVREGFARLLGDDSGHIALMGSTHDAVVRFLSALDWKKRRHVLTSDGEFHTLRRQLGRLQEEGVQLQAIAASPAKTLAERAVAALRDDTAAVMLSSVSFLSSEIVPELSALQAACDNKDIPLFIDVYHQLGVAPFSIEGLQNAYVTGGGYKYCQLGEGNCFLRFPKSSRLRPLVTGWYAEFDLLGEAPAMALTEYPDGPGRFAGATYDPVSHYRGAAVFEFFARQGLTPALLRQVSQHQIGRLCDAFDALALPAALIDRDRSVAREMLAGFLALRSPHAATLATKLHARGVDVDARGDVLRFGPAPYLCDRQLDEAMLMLGELTTTLE